MQATLSAPVQIGPGARQASFPEAKRRGRGVKHPPASSAEVKERVELYLYSLSGPSWPVIGRSFTFTFTVQWLENRARSLHDDHRNCNHCSQPVEQSVAHLKKPIRDSKTEQLLLLNVRD